MRQLLAVLAIALAAVTTSAGAGSASEDAGRIAFWSDEPWPSVWIMRPDGSGRHRIMHTRQNAKRARLSPDGRWVAFDGASPDTTALSDFDVQIVRRDGTGRRTVVRSPQQDLDAQ